MEQQIKGLYTVAGLDFKVDPVLLERGVLDNFQLFRQSRLGKRPFLFQLHSGKVPVTAGPPTTGQDAEVGCFRMWIHEQEAVVDFQSLFSQRHYRLLADRHWQELVMELPDTVSEEDDLAISCLIMAGFTYSAAFHGAVMLHASTVRSKDWAVAFIGQSGAGKSTHSQLWLRYFEGVSLLNDDQPVVRVIDGVPYIFGSPWSGKTPCYKNEGTRLIATFRMVQAPENRLTPLRPIQLFPQLLQACAMIREEPLTFGQITRTVADLAGKVKGYRLESRPEKEAAELTYRAAMAVLKKINEEEYGKDSNKA